MSATVEQYLHVVHVGFQLDEQARRPTQLLQDWWSLVSVAEATAQAGLRVSVIQSCAHPDQFTCNGVDYFFLAPEPRQSTIARGTALLELLRDLKADVLHVHGLCFPAEMLALSRLAPDTPILAQDHASTVPRIWRRYAWRRGLAAVSGIAFCSLEQARPFVKAGLIGPQTLLYAIPECPSRFTPGDQQEARRATGLHGDPCLLWVGHLNSNKDPLTVLNGVSQAMRQWPALQLWCCFASAPLLSEVQHRIAADPGLAQHVHLLGRQSHERIELLMRAADIFVLGSHREGCGYALIEALACGLPPVVSDIPSFRALTGGGKVGRLWPCDDAERLCAGLLATAAGPRSEQRAAARAHYEDEVSFRSVGRKLNSAYRSLLEPKRTRRHG
jgi:glycosyltransferase involved in cell wall biosynthesis